MQDPIIEKHINEHIAKHTDEHGIIDTVALRELYTSWLKYCGACGKSEYSEQQSLGQYPCLCWVYTEELYKKIFNFMTNEQQERFNKRFPDYSISAHEQDCECSKCNDCIDREEVKSFLDEEVALAVANKKKDIIKLLEKNANEINFNDLEVADIIDLISKLT